MSATATKPTGSPSLLVTMSRMDESGSGHYDGEIGCSVYRNADGDIEFECVGNHGVRTRTLASLLQNECRGLRSHELVRRIREVMHATTDDRPGQLDSTEQDYADTTEDGYNVNEDA